MRLNKQCKQEPKHNFTQLINKILTFNLSKLVHHHHHPLPRIR